MTMTMPDHRHETVTIEAPEAPKTILAVQGAEFARAVANASLFTAKTNFARPILEQVRVSVAGETITIESTDSYCLYRETITDQVPTSAPFHFFMDPAAAKAVASLVKGNRTGGLMTIELGAGQTAYAFAGQSSTVKVTDHGTYPNIEGLRSTDQAPTTRFALGADNLARIAKVKTETGAKGTCGQTVVFDRLNGELKPLTVRIGSTIDILVMPVRLG